MSGIPLLPPRCRAPGGVLLALGALLALARFRFGVKPAFLELRLFAVCSSYFQTRFFSSITKDATGELAALLVLAGLVTVAFSREEEEDASVDAARLRALLLATAANALLLALSFFSVFGLAFVYVLVANMYSTLLLYLVAFRWQLRARRLEAQRHPSSPRWQ